MTILRYVGYGAPDAIALAQGERMLKLYVLAYLIMKVPFKSALRHLCLIAPYNISQAA